MNALSLLAVLALSNAQSGDRPAGERAQVMILGVYHFDSPNLDLLKSPTVDHLAPAKQDEIAEVLDRLAAFAPTKIALEAVPEDARIQERYAKFLEDDDLALKGDEREQLGFQLAKQFAHPKLYLVDHQLGMDLGSVLAAAQESGDQRFLTWFEEAKTQGQALIERQFKATVREALVMLNEPALQDQTRDIYLQLARVRSPSAPVGADVVADWYRRNFRIFTNLAQAIDSPSDRVLVIYGQGHAPYLRELVRSSPDMELVEPNAYLGD